jgi:hypothetical protein
MPQIIETKKISDVLTHVNKETLVIFDIDNTLIEPVSFIGGTAWFRHETDRLIKKGGNIEELAEKFSALWGRVQPFIKIKTVESNTANVVKQLHEKDIYTMGLTGRSFKLEQITVDQLCSVDISIDNKTIYKNRLGFSGSTGFFGGVLSVGPTGHKGEVLDSFFRKINYNAKRILFIDDDPEYIEEVETVVNSKKIDFVGIRYRAADDRIEKFDPAKADEELKQIFSKINKGKRVDL